MQTYFILDELLIAGSIAESNKSLVNKELQIQKDVFDEKEEKNSKKWYSVPSYFSHTGILDFIFH